VIGAFGGRFFLLIFTLKDAPLPSCEDTVIVGT